MQKMTFLEDQLVQQRKKSMTLENQLSSAQDRIGGAERRAKALEDENVLIKGELQTWNDYYEQEQETGVEMPNIPTMSSTMTFAAPTLMNENPSSTPSIPVSNSSYANPRDDCSAKWNCTCWFIECECG